MRMTPGIALILDIICWSTLTFLMYAVGWLIPAVMVMAFAIILNGRHLMIWLKYRALLSQLPTRDFEDYDDYDD